MLITDSMTCEDPEVAWDDDPQSFELADPKETGPFDRWADTAEGRVLELALQDLDELAERCGACRFDASWDYVYDVLQAAWCFETVSEIAANLKCFAKQWRYSQAENPPMTVVGSIFERAADRLLCGYAKPMGLDAWLMLKGLPEETSKPKTLRERLIALSEQS